MVTFTELQQWASAIAQRFQPHKIILFGSRANGTSHTDSDVDLLVVMPHDGPPFKTAAKIRLSLVPLITHPVGIDILVRSPEELEHRLALGDPFFNTILSEGQTLYEQPGV
jgi:uncharacterized protein